ncbi:EAL domain, c-di-GMP-specific phosphodiesterase class I (or its enzymatically inactive variant) [Rhizobium sp. RU35A]|uniref:putative bifunctional diguanylate cyclase/phosphodiesterase n=1 Tax=Rhizobium sp. RU35A TaxID=1907414 RepID=UPI0009569B72|nr:EAL domain-containing protein [Rhizobium sp. RU35A]SIQ11562.1 EAL domain, c-di-GMP-specific phosphodiesterase class I (or its enzymatically inactive variant) [Rhizobium sp. RU35A]
MQQKMGADTEFGQKSRTFDEHAAARADMTACLHHVSSFASQLFGVDGTFITLDDRQIAVNDILAAQDASGNIALIRMAASDDVVVVLDRASLSADASVTQTLPAAASADTGFLAGAPLRGADGVSFGMFWIVGKHPRDGFSPGEQQNLRAIASIAANHLLARQARHPDALCAGFADEAAMHRPDHLQAAKRSAQSDIARALRRAEFVLQYQPQVSLEDDSLCGMEALIRWQHPVRGLLPPAEFLPLLEHSPLSLDVGWWVLSEAVRQMGEWQAKGLTRVKMSVNLFPLQLRSPGFIEAVADLLTHHGVEPRFLELEITETAALTDGDESLRVINGLRDIGVGIAFDDFGTGYASLGTLQHYPITTLKIDRGFVRDLLTRQRDAAITRALIMLSRDIGVTTIAEGIETIEQELTLKMMGCDCGQGYLFGRSMPASDIAGLLARQPVPAAVARAG